LKISWNSKGLRDLSRLYVFLEAKSPLAAAKVIQRLAQAPDKLVLHPRLGERLDGFGHDEVRRLVVDGYELRYQVDGETIHVLRVWHSLEDRK